MLPTSTPAGQALAIEFVADLSYNPRTNQYRVELTEPYRSDLPRDRNYLLVDVKDFTIERLLAVFQRDVVDYYQQKCEQAQRTLDRLRNQPPSGG